MYRERRLKAYFLSKEDVLRTMLRQHQHEVEAIIHYKELPIGYEILTVDYDYRYAGFVFLIHHPTFPEIPEGDEIPVISTFDTVVKAYKIMPYKVEE